MSEITKHQIDKVLAEAKSAKLPDDVASAQAATTPQSISFSGFKTAWPKTIRPIVLFAVNLLTMFRLTTYANYISQAVVFIDMVLGGQMIVTP